MLKKVKSVKVQSNTNNSEGPNLTEISRLKAELENANLEIIKWKAEADNLREKYEKLSIERVKYVAELVELRKVDKTIRKTTVCDDSPCDLLSRWCSYCRVYGHTNSVCRKLKKRPRGCWKCGMTGHKKIDCINPQSGGAASAPDIVFKPKEIGSLLTTQDNSKTGNDILSKWCTYCREYGHTNRVCRKMRKKPRGCWRCGMPNHKQKDCKNPRIKGAAYAPEDRGSCSEKNRHRLEDRGSCSEKNRHRSEDRGSCSEKNQDPSSCTEQPSSCPEERSSCPEKNRRSK